MKTVSTLLISTGLVAALLSGASMAMRSDAAPRGSAQVSRGIEAGAPVQAWSNPPERAPAAPALPESGMAEAGEPAERRIEGASDAAPAAPRPSIRRNAARADASKRAEIARPQRRMAQASPRTRSAALRAAPVANGTVASPARPLDPISDFLRGVGLIDDHG